MGGFVVPRSFLESPRWWRGGGEWLAGLPDLVREQCARWRLTVDGEPAHGSNALVVPVVRDGAGFVLRLTPPGPDVAELIAALRLWDGRGTVRLVDADPDAGVMLLERLSPVSLNDVPVDEAMHVLGGVMRRLAVPVPDHVLSTGAAVARRMSAMRPEWERLGRPFDARILDEALAIGDRLSREAGGDAVNGDLHSAQVLRTDRNPAEPASALVTDSAGPHLGLGESAGGRGTWLVVDPVLMRGDRAFDLGRVLWTRLDEMPRDEDVVRCFGIAVRAAGIAPGHGLDWVLYRAVDYWLWGLGVGLTEDPVRCRRLVSVFRQ